MTGCLARVAQGIHLGGVGGGKAQTHPFPETGSPTLCGSKADGACESRLGYSSSVCA